MLRFQINALVIELSLSSVFANVPFVGQIHLSRQLGLVATRQWDAA